VKNSWLELRTPQPATKCGAILHKYYSTSNIYVNYSFSTSFLSLWYTGNDDTRCGTWAGWLQFHCML